MEYYTVHQLQFYHNCEHSCHSRQNKKSSCERVSSRTAFSSHPPGKNFHTTYCEKNDLRHNSISCSFHIAPISSTISSFQVPKIVYEEEIVERKIPQTQTTVRYVEVPQVHERIQRVTRQEFQEEIVEVPKIEYVERLVEREIEQEIEVPRYGF